MAPDATKVLRQALRLPQPARAAIAGKLIRSLDSKTDPDAEAAWAAEIDRRLDLLDSGKAKTISWQTVEKRIKASRRGPRKHR